MRDATKFGAETTASEVADGIDLHGKVALVTGGSSGLGQETARVLAERGAHVILTARDMPKGETGAAAIRASTGNPPVEVAERELGPPEQIRAFAGASWRGTRRSTASSTTPASWPARRRRPRTASSSSSARTTSATS